MRWWTGLTLGDQLDKAADIYPNKEALVDDRSRLTYSQVRDTVNRLAISLVQLGIKTLDRVLVQLPNWSEFVYSSFALQKIGAIPVLLIDRYRSYEVGHLFRLTGVTSWIVPEEYRKTGYSPNTPGGLIIKETGVFTGYYKAPRENEMAFDKEGFLEPGISSRWMNQVTLRSQAASKR